MIQEIPCYSKPFTMSFNLQSLRPQTVRIVAWNSKKPCTKYYDRYVDMTQEPRPFTLSFPTSPNTLTLAINGVDSTNMKEPDRNLKVYGLELGHVKSGGCSLGGNDKVFFDFVRLFAEQAGWLKAGIYRKGKYTIIYNEQIRDKKGGQTLNTPARIGHDSGIIEASREKFLNYSIPQRLIILLHEGGHKFYNPSMGADIENEVAADLNALYIYLCKGYPAREAYWAFSQVFHGAKNAQNDKRLNIIKDFITRFEKGEIT